MSGVDYWEPWRPKVGQRVRVRLSPECPHTVPNHPALMGATAGFHDLSAQGDTGTVDEVVCDDGFGPCDDTDLGPSLACAGPCLLGLTWCARGCLLQDHDPSPCAPCLRHCYMVALDHPLAHRFERLAAIEIEPFIEVDL